MASADVDKKKALGRGLASLIPGGSAKEAVASPPHKKDYFLCDIEKIVPNTYQPRKVFQKEALEELVQSVTENGIIQPLVVRIKDGHYELIAGERRWRAAQKAGFKQVPVVVKNSTEDQASLELAIIENIQRKDLNCIEEAMAYQQLVDQFDLSHDEVAQKMGKNRSTVANLIRLLKLPISIREDIASEKLSMGHARALLTLTKAELQVQVRDEIISQGLSVRETENRVNEIVGQEPASQGGPSSPVTKKANVHLDALAEKFLKTLGMKVQIKGTAKKGKVIFRYQSLDDLNQLSDKILTGDDH